MTNKTALIIDGHDHLHRAFYAFPDTLTDKEGHPINSVYGFTSILLSSINSLNPDYIFVAFDISTKDLERTKKFPEYKGTRVKMEPAIRESFVFQEKEVKNLLKLLKIPIITKFGYEADDVIGTFSKIYDKEFIKTYIQTNDRDMLQLITPNVCIRTPSGRFRREKDWTKQEFVKEYEFNTDQLIYYKALRGDSSDNIPGVYGVGDKTARILVKKYETLDGIYENIDSVTPESLKNKLIKNKDNAYLSLDLATIQTEIDLDVTLKDTLWNNEFTAEFVDKIKEYNFKSLIRKYFETETFSEKPNNDPQLSLI